MNHSRASNTSHFIGVRFSAVGPDLPVGAVNAAMLDIRGRIERDPHADIRRIIIAGCDGMLRFRGAVNVAAFICFGPRPVVVVYDALESVASNIELDGPPLTTTGDERVTQLVDRWATWHERRSA